MTRAQSVHNRNLGVEKGVDEPDFHTSDHVLSWAVIRRIFLEQHCVLIFS